MPGLERRITTLLAAANRAGGFPMSLVCTDQGLLVAAAGEVGLGDDLAALASIFDDVVTRARRDLGMSTVDELAVRDPGVGRLVLRPIAMPGGARMFLVVQVPSAASWRRTTNRLCSQLEGELAGLGSGAPEGGDHDGA